MITTIIAIIITIITAIIVIITIITTISLIITISLICVQYLPTYIRRGDWRAATAYQVSVERSCQGFQQQKSRTLSSVTALQCRFKVERLEDQDVVDQ